MSDTAWIVRNPSGRIVTLSDPRPVAPKGHTVERLDRHEACELARRCWFPEKYADGAEGGASA